MVQNSIFIFGELFIFRDFFIFSESFIFRDFFIFRNFFIFSEIFIFRDFFIFSEIFVLSDFFIFRDIFIFSEISVCTEMFLKNSCSKNLRSFSVEQPCWSPFEVHLQAFLRTFLRLLPEKGTPQQTISGIFQNFKNLQR